MARCPNCYAVVSGDDAVDKRCSYCGAALSLIDGDTGERIVDAVTDMDAKISQLSDLLLVGSRETSQLAGSIVIGRARLGSHAGSDLVWEVGGPTQRHALVTESRVAPIKHNVAQELLDADTLTFLPVEESAYVCSACGLRYHPTRSTELDCSPACPRCTLRTWADQMVSQRLERDESRHARAADQLREARQHRAGLKHPKPVAVLVYPFTILSDSPWLAVILGLVTVVAVASTRGVAFPFAAAAYLAVGAILYRRSKQSARRRLEAANRRVSNAENKLQRADGLFRVREREHGLDREQAYSRIATMESDSRRPLETALDRKRWRRSLGAASPSRVPSDLELASSAARGSGATTVSSLSHSLGWTRTWSREVLEHLVESDVVGPSGTEPWHIK